MSVEIRGAVTIITSEKPDKDGLRVLIWTIGVDSVETVDIDRALETAFPERYKEFDQGGEIYAS